MIRLVAQVADRYSGQRVEPSAGSVPGLARAGFWPSRLRAPLRESRTQVAGPRVCPDVNCGYPTVLHIDVFELDAPCSAVDVDGELDLATAERLAEALHEELGSNHRFTVLDVSGLTFCDATGLGVLLRAHHEYTAADGRLTLARVGPRLARLLHLTALDSVLNVAPVRPATDGSELPPRERI